MGKFSIAPVVVCVLVGVSVIPLSECHPADQGMSQKECDNDLDQLLKRTFTTEFRTGYVKIKGMTIPNVYLDIADSIENLKIWDDDVWVCSFPKSGTTWTQEMVWLLGHDLDIKGAEEDLTIRFPFLEASGRFNNTAIVEKFPEVANHGFVQDSVKYVEDLPRPRYIKCHLPFHLLPRDLREGRTKTKIVYVYRNPKDVCISFYHHAKHFAFRGNFKEFATLFRNDRVPYAPYWNHIFGYWNKRNDPSYNILFIKYEEMKSDLASAIDRVLTFLNKPKLCSEELSLVMDHLSFGKMKNNKAVNHQSMFEFTKKYLNAVGNAEFIRRGQVNQWKTEMTPEILKKFDDWISKNLKNSDFSL
ncbi:amine sulfotransferase [Diachasma alloeum]|uniref:amine sulfotransferase n=1 Tax=Diachasma alloeum TaxID=454923 RepID=UPI0007382CF5|nr:amine sulfotransferase [Diachasma alloeum]